jgi:hypothetical protein
LGFSLFPPVTRFHLSIHSFGQSFITLYTLSHYTLFYLCHEVVESHGAPLEWHGCRPTAIRCGRLDMENPGWVPVPATKDLTTSALSDVLSRDPTPPIGQPTMI